MEKKSAQPKIKPSDIAGVLVRVKGIGVKNAAEVMAAINELYRTGEVEEG